MKQRLALCVGINDYPSSASDLSGCVNDAMDWTSALASRGYSIVTLLDSEASKANVVKALQEALSLLKRRDRFVFTFSGHGTWVPDRDGDETDQRDEALCCQDYDTGGLLTDDEMHAIFQDRKRGSRVTIISDSCHSGTMARLMMDRSTPLDPPITLARTAKFIPPPLFSDITPEEAARREAVLPPSKPRSGTILISGCADNEYSYDTQFNARPNGAFSYFALQTLKHSETVEDVYAGIRAMLPNATLPQTPQLTAGPFQKISSLL